MNDTVSATPNLPMQLLALSGTITVRAPRPTKPV